MSAFDNVVETEQNKLPTILEEPRKIEEMIGHIIYNKEKKLQHNSRVNINKIQPNHEDC